MEFMINHKTYSLFILSSLLLLNSCKDAVAPDYNNVNDSKSELFQGQSPSNFTVTVLSQNVIKLEWQNNSNYENGYVIERSINNDSNFVKIGQVGQNITSFTDSSAVENNRNAYYYQLRMQNSITNHTANIIAGPYIDKIKIAENIGGFCVSPNGEYIAIWRFEGSGNENGRVIVYNTSDGGEILNIAYNTEYFSIALSNDNIAILKYGGLDIWRIRDGVLIAKTPSPNDVATFIAINHKGNTIALYDNFEPGLFYVWNLEDSLSLIVREQLYAEYRYLEFSENDQYLVAISLNLYDQYAVYNTNTWEIIFSADIYGSYIVPHIVNQDKLFYLSNNSFCFYDLNQNTIVSTINDLNYVINDFRWRNRVNINNAGSILSVFRGATTIKIDFWSLTSDYKLFKRFQTIDFGNDVPTDNAFTSKNDFIVKTYSKNLYLWKYYRNMK